MFNADVSSFNRPVAQYGMTEAPIASRTRSKTHSEGKTIDSGVFKTRNITTTDYSRVPVNRSGNSFPGKTDELSVATMEREVRIVPPYWEHPRAEDGRYIPLLPARQEEDCDYSNLSDDFDDRYLARCFDDNDLAGSCDRSNQAADCDLFDEDDCDFLLYMPVYPKGSATHYMMYETESSGTPISPALATPEELADWLANNQVSAYEDYTITYESWLRIVYGSVNGVGVVVYSNGRLPGKSGMIE